MNFMPDTNTLIYMFKGLGNVATHFYQHAPQDFLISTVVIYELEVGIAKSTDPYKR